MPPSESKAFEIHCAVALPEDPAENTQRHADLISALIAEAAARGWSGADFCAYERRGDIVTAGISESGAPWPGVPELRAFRDRQRIERAAAEDAERQAARQAELQQQQQGNLQL